MPFTPKRACDSPGHENRLPTLDGLRAVAILTVIASHVFHGSGNRLAMLGQAGVLLFFALSGYLITTRLLAEQATNGEISTCAAPFASCRRRSPT